MKTNIFKKQRPGLKFFILILGIIISIWLPPVLFEITLDSYFAFNEDTLSLLFCAAVLFIVYVIIILILLWIYESFKKNSPDKTETENLKKITKGEKNIIAALIIGVCIIISIYIYAQANRYQSIRDGYLILDKWTGKTHSAIKNNRNHE